MRAKAGLISSLRQSSQEWSQARRHPALKRYPQIRRSRSFEGATPELDETEFNGNRP